MPKQQIVDQLKNQKDKLNMTIKDISENSGVSIRSVNRVLAGEDVRYSAVEAVIEALGLSILIDKKHSA
jgi:predicted transcriptional regulator